MATAKWATPNAQGANLASTTLDSLANAATSAFVTMDNSGGDLYAFVELVLGSITPAAGGSVTLRVFSTTGSGPTVPDASGSVGGGEAYTIPLTTGAGIKTSVVRIQLPPGSLRVCVTNNAGVSLAASGNSLKFQTFNESVA